MRRIADTGLLKAALDADDCFHEWGAEAMRMGSPFYTCEPVLVELAFLLGTGSPGLIMLERGDLVVEFSVSAESPRLLQILNSYRDRQIDLADACVVRMSELEKRSKIWTVDRSDFQVYRRFGTEIIPCEFPPG